MMARNSVNSEQTYEAAEALRRAPRHRWWDEAACRGKDTELFLDSSRAAVADAKGHCATCSVRVDCLADALRVPLIVGVWGGTTARERDLLRAALAPRSEIVFDERVPSPTASTPATQTTSTPAATGPDELDAPPEWVRTGSAAARWQHAGHGPGPAGRWVVDGIEIVVRFDRGTHSAYVRAANVGAA
jgi:WhiB family transcriptional regulator, redox-sensing transcriptional regulator